MSDVIEDDVVALLAALNLKLQHSVLELRQQALAQWRASHTYNLGAGTVQPCVTRDTPFFMFHFGRAAYHRDLPVLSESIREQASQIVQRLNAGEITEEEAKRQLGKIYF